MSNKTEDRTYFRELIRKLKELRVSARKHLTWSCKAIKRNNNILWHKQNDYKRNIALLEEIQNVINNTHI